MMDFDVRYPTAIDDDWDGPEPKSGVRPSGSAPREIDPDDFADEDTLVWQKAGPPRAEVAAPSLDEIDETDLAWEWDDTQVDALPPQLCG